MSDFNQHQTRSLVERIAATIDAEKRQITNRELLSLCGAEGIKSVATDPHLCHEIAETALNQLVRDRYGKILLDSADPSACCSEVLKPLQNRLPTQTWRSSTQICYQQFSTPASIAYLGAFLLNLNADDVVLEPSCGTGSLAVWAQAAGATVLTNEIDPRRRELSKLLGFNPTELDAEFIDDLLTENDVPNVIFANPPFSSTGGRVEQNHKKFGFRHVESALRRLERGGRFAIILGESGSPRNASGRKFWQSLLPDIRLRASIELPGREYYRNGTTVGVTLLLGSKLSSRESQETRSVEEPIRISASTVEVAFNQALAGELRF
jgi:type I restriction-modification system DNA methylase subunit